MLKLHNLCFETQRSHMLAELQAMRTVSNHWNYYLKRIKEMVINACIESGFIPDSETLNQTIIHNFDFFYNSAVNTVTEKSCHYDSAPKLMPPQVVKPINTTIPEVVLI